MCNIVKSILSMSRILKFSYVQYLILCSMHITLIMLGNGNRNINFPKTVAVLWRIGCKCGSPH